MACAPSIFGRPREHDRELIAKDLIEWAKKDDSINLNGFCCSREPPLNPRKLSEWAKEDVDFREAYELAKAFLGDRREKKLNANQLHVKAYDLNASVYDYYLKQEKREQAEFESNLKARENAVVSEEDVARLDSYLNQLTKVQSSLGKSKQASNKSKAE